MKKYDFDSLEILWETYDFHTDKILELESIVQEDFDHLHSFLDQNLNPNQNLRHDAKKVVEHDCNQAISTYQKQIAIIDELIEYYKYYKAKKISEDSINKIKQSKKLLCETYSNIESFLN